MPVQFGNEFRVAGGKHFEKGKHCGNWFFRFTAQYLYIYMFSDVHDLVHFRCYQVAGTKCSKFVVLIVLILVSKLDGARIFICGSVYHYNCRLLLKECILKFKLLV